MASSKDYLHIYKKFFEDFASSIQPYDQLPVKVSGYYIRESEIRGEVIDWTLQYLTQKRCPSSLVTPLMKTIIKEVEQACVKNRVDFGFMEPENVYQPLRLMHAVMSNVNDVCLRYKDNGLLHTLPEPAPKSFISACAIKNSRRRMEDRHVIIEDFHSIFGIENCGPASYFAVFDGHAGIDAAAYSVSHLHQFLAESEHYPTDPERALKEAFLKTDALFVQKSHKQNLHSGTTAVCALLRPNKVLYVAWLGDSQALLVRRGRPISIVNPHKPERDDERRRIENMGGSVLYWGTWRVNGQLAVSRAIGDLEYKPYVTAEPDIVTVPLDGTEDFLILGCDGLWDFVPEEAIVRAVYQQLKRSPGDLESVTEALVQLSKEQGSTDNISVIVVFLTEPTKLLDEPQLWERLNAPKAMDTQTDINSCQKTGFQLDLDSGGACKQNGTDLDHIFLQRSTNGKDASEGVYDDYDDEDFGPETDVDTVDDVLLSPAIAAAKMLASANKNELLIENRTAVDVIPELQKGKLGEFDTSAPRGDTPTPPADEVASANREALEVDNAGDSGEDSEDEWNYFAVEPKKKPALEAISLPQEQTIDCDSSEAERQERLDMESRLNPNAAEFVPSPTHVPVLDDCMLACSPRKDEKLKIAALPSEQEFDDEARKCPGQEIEPDDVALVRDTCVKPQSVDAVSIDSSQIHSTVLHTPDFFSKSSLTSKNPFGDDFKDILNENDVKIQSEKVCDVKLDSGSSIESDFINNSSEPMSFELKKEICPEMEPEPERVCLGTLVDDLAENGLSPTVSPDISEPSHKEKIDEFEPFLAICPQKLSDVSEDLKFIPEQTFETLIGRINAELKESADAFLSSCTTAPDTTGFDETGGSLSPLDTDAVETKPDSTSDKHLLEFESEFIPESRHVDSTTLSESTTDSSPVNYLIDDSSSLNKVIDDASPLSEHSEAYKPLQEQADASPLEEQIESLSIKQEQKESVSPSLKYFGDDAPFHGFTQSEPLEDLIDSDVLQKNAENVRLSDSVDVIHLHDQMNELENAVGSHDHIRESSMHGKLDRLSHLLFGDFQHERNDDLNSFDIVSSTTRVNQEVAQKIESDINAGSDSVESAVKDLHIVDDPSSAMLDLNSHFSEKLLEMPIHSTVTNIVESEVPLQTSSITESKELEREVIDFSPSAPDQLLLEENESLKFDAEVLEKELKDNEGVISADVARSELENTLASQTPPSTPVVVEPETGVLPTFEPEVSVGTIEKLIVSPNKESVGLEQLQDFKPNDSADKTLVSEVAPVAAATVVAAAAVTAGAVLAAEKTSIKETAAAKTPPSSKPKKPIVDKKSPAAPKLPATQKTMAASPRALSSTTASRASPKPSVSPAKTLTSTRKMATPTTTKPKSPATTTVTASPLTPTSASSTPRSKPLSARTSVGGAKPSVPLKSSPVQKPRPTSAVTKTSIEKKPAPIANGIMKPPVKDQVSAKRTTVSSAKTLGSPTSTVTASKQATSRSTTTKTTTITSTGTAAKPRNLPFSTIGATKQPARAPISAITQKQVKETANKQISSARPSSAVSVSRTSTTTTTSRRVSTGVARTTTTTSTTMSCPKSNLGSKVTTKKTTTITSRTSAPAKAKSQAIENNEQITTTVIATEMKVDPIETTQPALLE